MWPTTPPLPVQPKSLPARPKTPSHIVLASHVLVRGAEFTIKPPSTAGSFPIRRRHLPHPSLTASLGKLASRPASFQRSNHPTQRAKLWADAPLFSPSMTAGARLDIQILRLQQAVQYAHLHFGRRLIRRQSPCFAPIESTPFRKRSSAPPP